MNLKLLPKNLSVIFFEEPYFERIHNKRVSVLHHPELIDEKMTKENDLFYMDIHIDLDRK